MVGQRHKRSVDEGTGEIAVQHRVLQRHVLSVAREEGKGKKAERMRGEKHNVAVLELTLWWLKIALVIAVIVLLTALTLRG